MSKWRKHTTQYPFIVMGARSRLIKVDALKFSNALSRALSLHPNKFLKTQFAKRMDLITAQEEAKKKSLKSAHKQFVVLLPDGDFEIENQFSLDDKADVYATWHKGKKVEGPAVKKVAAPDEDEPKVAKAPKRAEVPTKKELKQAVKKSSIEQKVKNAAEKIVEKVFNQGNSIQKSETMKTKKVEVKKVVKKVAAKKAKAPGKVKKIEGAKIVPISIKEMRANLKKGFRYYDPQGVSQTEKYMASRANQDYVREGMQEVKPAKK